MHILAGILWIGMLYFFNFVNGPFVGAMDADTKKKVIPELAPRALFWFRWGAAWTWITGVLLLMLVFYHGGALFQGDAHWDAPTIVMIVLVFVAPFIYDALHKSGLGKNPMVFASVAFALAAAVIAAMQHWAHFSYRGFNIHMGAMFGTIMAFNVWFRIWPAQQVIIKGVKGDGPAAPPELAAMAGARSRHNVFMSVPLFWAMINSHTEAFAGGRYGIAGDYSFLVFLGITLVGWHIVSHLYKMAPKVKGF
jgi:uncharacterized membrane protein